MHKLISTLLALLMVFAFSTQYCQAAWDDKSDELPGLISDEAVIALVAGTVVVLGVATWLIIKSAKNRATADNLMQYRDAEGNLIRVPSTGMAGIRNHTNPNPVQVTLGVGNPAYDFSSNSMKHTGVTVGLRFNF